MPFLNEQTTSTLAQQAQQAADAAAAEAKKAQQAADDAAAAAQQAADDAAAATAEEAEEKQFLAEEAQKAADAAQIVANEALEASREAQEAAHEAQEIENETPFDPTTAQNFGSLENSVPEGQQDWWNAQLVEEKELRAALSTAEAALSTDPTDGALLAEVQHTTEALLNFVTQAVETIRFVNEDSNHFLEVAINFANRAKSAAKDAQDFADNALDFAQDYPTEVQSIQDAADDALVAAKKAAAYADSVEDALALSNDAWTTVLDIEDALSNGVSGDVEVTPLIQQITELLEEAAQNQSQTHSAYMEAVSAKSSARAEINMLEHLTEQKAEAAREATREAAAAEEAANNGNLNPVELYNEIANITSAYTFVQGLDATYSETIDLSNHFQDLDGDHITYNVYSRSSGGNEGLKSSFFANDKTGELVMKYAINDMDYWVENGFVLEGDTASITLNYTVEVVASDNDFEANDTFDVEFNLTLDATNYISPEEAAQTAPPATALPNNFNETNEEVIVSLEISDQIISLEKNVFQSNVIDLDDHFLDLNGDALDFTVEIFGGHNHLKSNGVFLETSTSIDRDNNELTMEYFVYTSTPAASHHTLNYTVEVTATDGEYLAVDQFDVLLEIDIV